MNDRSRVDVAVGIVNEGAGTESDVLVASVKIASGWRDTKLKMTVKWMFFEITHSPCGT